MGNRANCYGYVYEDARGQVCACQGPQQGVFSMFLFRAPTSAEMLHSPANFILARAYFLTKASFDDLFPWHLTDFEISLLASHSSILGADVHIYRRG